MSARLFAGMAAILCLIFSVSTLAQEQNSVNDEIKRVQLMLMVINAELKSDLDQILVLQEAIRGNSRTPLLAQGRSPDTVTVEEALAAERIALQREAAISARLDAILARSAALDAEKQPLVERLRELGRVTPVLEARTPSAVELEK